MFACPQPFHGERNPSCGVSASKEIGNCFACGQHFNLVQLVSHCKEISYLDALEFLSSFFNRDFRSVSKTELRLYGEEVVENDTLPIYELAPFNSGNIVHNYLLDRGFTQDDFIKFNLGWDTEKKRITIPFFNEYGELLGFSGRAVMEENDYGYESIYGTEAKYHIYNHFNAKKYFYPLNLFQPKDDTVILVEGLLDAMWLQKNGYSNALSIISAEISKVQVQKIKTLGVSKIILCLDNDNAGIKGCERLYKLLKNDFTFKQAILPEGKKDVQECTKEELDLMFSNLISYPKRIFKMYEQERFKLKSNLFKLGFEDVKAMDAEAKAVSSNRGIYDFYVKDGQETLMRFLTDQPVAFKAHTIKVGKAPRVFVCTEDENCLGCKQPDSFDATKMNKASVKAAFLVLDGSVVEKDEMENGQPTGKKVQYTDQIKVMVRGVNDIAVIQRNAEKHGLLNRAYYCSKQGQKNPYTFDRVDGCPKGKDAEFWSQSELSQEAIDKLIEKLPEKYREMAKGEGGFYAVLQSLFVPYGEVPVVEEAQGLTRC